MGRASEKYGRKTTFIQGLVGKPMEKIPWKTYA
jgi:hypothetical protein